MDRDREEEQREIFEEVPWERIRFGGHDRRWLVYAGAAAVVVAVATAAIVGRPHPPPDAEIAQPIAETTAPPQSQAPLATHPVDPTIPTAPAMSLTPPTDRSAEAVATWFVRDLLTIDGSETDPFQTWFGVDSPLDRSGRSYVEWTEVARVGHVDAGVIEVEVFAGVLSAVDGETYRRTPVRSVTVVVASTPEGWIVADLPRAMTEVSPAGRALPEPAAPLPEDIVAAAEDLMDGEVIAGGSVNGAWRVVVAVEDAAGGRWPVAVTLDDDGRRVGP